MYISCYTYNDIYSYVTLVGRPRENVVNEKLLYTEKSFLNLVNPTQVWIVNTLFSQSENCNYNPNCVCSDWQD